MKPSFRASEASPASSPATMYAAGWPFTPRAVSQSVAATSGWRIAKFSGWGMNTAPAAGTAARSDAPSRTSRLAPASVAMAQVSGAVSEPTSASGSAEAHAVGPNTVMNGTWRNDDSGSQWAFEGIGRAGVGGVGPPASAKSPTKSTPSRPGGGGGRGPATQQEE